MKLQIRKKIKITWPEGRELFDFTFKTNDARIHVKEIVERHNYEDNFPDLMGVNSVVLSEKEQKAIVEKRLEMINKNMNNIKKLLEEANLKLNMIASDDPDKTEKILQAAEITKRYQDKLEMWKKYQTDVSNIVMNRSKKIPKDIPNYECWNDCWMDGKSNCIVTFNTHWNQEWVKQFDEVKKFEENNTIPNVYAVPLWAVWFLHGYPILSKEIAEDIEMPQTYFPTMTDEMLNDEMISKKFGLEKDVDYPTPMKKGTLTYNVSPGSKLILKNGEKYRFTRKETIFFLNRKMIPENEIPLLP